MSPKCFIITVLPIIALTGSASAQNSGPSIAAPAPWPDAKPGTILSTPDWSDYRIYPAAARRKGVEGAVDSEILVGTSGVPTECRTLRSSGSPDLDSGTCELMMKMRFEPARDAAGKAAASSFRRRVYWVLFDPRPLASSALEAEVRLNPVRGGRCDVTRAEGAYSAAWSTLACSFFGDRNYYFGANADGAHRFIVAVRLDAGDQSDFLARPWPTGKMVAQEKVAFEVNKEGDPSNCTAEPRWGFGVRGANNLSPCGRLLSMLWLKDAFQKHGSMETRVYLADDAQ